MKPCPRCGTQKQLSDFYSDPTKQSGLMSHCKDCCNAARRRRYQANLEHERNRSRRYYEELSADQRAAKNHRAKAWRHANPDKARDYARNYWREHRRTRSDSPEKARATYMKRHGGLEEWARMMQAQDGLCYLCAQPLEGTRQSFIHVDHDHDCCPTGQNTQSCPACRRGLAHAWCNQIIGLCGEDMDTLRTIVARFEPARDAAAARVAARKASAEALF